MKNSLFDFNSVTPEKAYCWGFIWGDGYFRVHGGVNRNQNSLVIEAIEDDLQHLYPAFDSLGEWNKYRRERVGRKPQASLRLLLTPYLHEIQRLNLVTKSKDSAYPLLMEIPEELHTYWYRGYFDADGHYDVTNSQFILSSHYDADLDFLESTFRSLKLPITRKFVETSKGHKHQRTRITGKSNLGILRDYLYADHVNIGLPRKFDALVQAAQYKYPK